VFDTLATGAQRQLNENFSLFIPTFVPKYPEPDADAIENLTRGQKRLGARLRPSTQLTGLRTLQGLVVKPFRVNKLF
jgi:hypothetical protein